MRQSVMERNCLGFIPAIKCYMVLCLSSTIYYGTVLHLSFWSPPPYTQAASAVPPVLPRFPHYIAGVSEHSIMLNQNSLCFDTEKWFLCNNTIVFV